MSKGIKIVGIIDVKALDKDLTLDDLLHGIGRLGVKWKGVIGDNKNLIVLYKEVKK